MNVALFEDSGYLNLLPLTWLRAAFELRCGRDRLIDKLVTHLDARIAALFVRPELQAIVAGRTPLAPPDNSANWTVVNARCLPTAKSPLPPLGVAWTARGALIAATITSARYGSISAELFLDGRRLSDWLADLQQEPAPDTLRLMDYPWDLISSNGDELRNQLTNLHAAMDGQLHSGAHVVNPGRIRIASGAVIKPGVVLDAENGPIEIDHGVLIEPNAVIQGPCFVGAKSVIRPGAVIRESTTIGPVCKVGGEIEACVFQGHSNKQHDGFLGHTYVASWVNLGADTVTSDLKNTYGTIRVRLNGVGVETGKHFLGSIIGDHAKTGIGTILPTGCILGLAANVFTQGAVPKFVPSFGWLTDHGLEPCRVEKILEIARAVMARRNVELSLQEQQLIRACAAQARQVEVLGWSNGSEAEVRSAV